MVDPFAGAWLAQLLPTLNCEIPEFYYFPLIADISGDSLKYNECENKFYPFLSFFPKKAAVAFLYSSSKVSSSK
jgi:hypothetical protein